MPPPPAEPFATRILLGPALRAQPDRRLVKLVREGYETAFEEIVRRYRKPLDRFAAAIVGGRSEDVTQDAFSKALLALRGTTTEIELKPWLYRIVRNTALNDLRDGPPLTEELAETIPGGQSAAVEAERREEIGELMERLRALPEPQRAAIVMRELEGLSHEEIAAALGVSGGAARQAIYRGRPALRDGLGLLIPLPLLRVLFDHAAEAAGAGAGGALAAAGAASVAGGTGATVGGFGAVGALKVGVATALLAGSVGAGVAMQHDRGERSGPEPAAAAAAQPPRGGDSPGASGSPSGAGAAPLIGSAEDRGHGGSGSGEDSEDQRGRDGEDANDLDDSSHEGNGHSPGGSSGHGGHGSGHGGRSGPDDDSGESHSGEGLSARGHSGGHGSSGSSGGSGRGGGSSEGSGHGSGSGESDGGENSHSGSSSGGSGSGHGDSGSGEEAAPVASPPPTSEPLPEDSDDGEESGSGSGDSGSGGDGSHGGEDDS